MNKKLAILGAGNMGLAIADGILKSELLEPSGVILVRRSLDKLSKYKDMGCIVTDDVREAAKSADVLLLAFKPQMLSELFSSICDVCDGKLVVSIAAGVTVEKIEKALAGAKVVRAMPNTPLTVGEGITELCRGEGISDEEFSFVRSIFDCAGCTVECREEDINAFTALTSSAVAYYALFADAMCDWAKNNGLSDFEPERLCELVCRTAIGASKLMVEKDISPKALIKSVASPNGTTERALSVFSDEDIAGIIKKAMTACRDRADELSKL